MEPPRQSYAVQRPRPQALEPYSLGLSHSALFSVCSIAVGIMILPKPQHPVCAVRSAQALACRVAGGWVAQMTGGVLARYKLSHVLMAVTKANWLVGLAR